MTKTYIKVPLEWLEGLAEWTKRVDEDSEYIDCLLGYTSTAKTIIEHNERVEE